MQYQEHVFDYAHQHVAQWEGGFFDHPNDPGGVTNCGVSLMFLKSLELIEGDIDGDGVITRADVLAITRDTARDIFHQHFWMTPRAYTLPPRLAMAFYDLAVNAGPGRAAITLQEAINTLRPGVIPRYAPNLGPLTTRHCAELASEQYELPLAHAYLDRRIDWYQRLVRARPSSLVFLRGWLNRTTACRRLVSAW